MRAGSASVGSRRWHFLPTWLHPRRPSDCRLTFWQQKEHHQTTSWTSSWNSVKTLPMTDAFPPVKQKTWGRPLIDRDLAEIKEHAEGLANKARLEAARSPQSADGCPQCLWQLAVLLSTTKR